MPVRGGYQPKQSGDPKIPTTGSGVKPPRPTVTIVVPCGYKDANEFLKDCGFEPAPTSSNKEQT